MLAFHDKLREENNNKARMDKAARKIKRLVYILEQQNTKNPPVQINRVLHIKFMGVGK